MVDVRHISETPCSSEPDTLHHNIEDLMQICESAVWSVEPQAVYQRMTDALAQTLGCEAAYIHLLAVTGDHMTRYASHGDHAAMGRSDGRVSLTTGRLPRMLLDRQPIIMDYLHPHDDDEIPSLAREIGHISAVTVPLLACNDVVGIYTVSYKQRKCWTDEDIAFLLAIGRLLGVLIQQTQMMKKTIELQTLLERKRLSAEIHDNLSQLITLLKLGAETALISYEEGDSDAMRGDLARLSQTSGEALKVLREEMLYLRTSINETEGLVSSIKACLERFDGQWDIGACLEVDGLVEPVIVSMQTELQLTRILHEALSNTLRHSGASRVTVGLKEDAEGLSMVICDDGCGFDPERIAPERLGIRIMQERAESFGGSVAIRSQKGEGATVQVRIPRQLW